MPILTIVTEIFRDEPSIRSGLTQVLAKYPNARKNNFTGHPLGSLLRDDLPNAIRRNCSDVFKVKGSAGQSTWAETVWVAIFDPQITTSAQKGVYVVYLFDMSGRHVYLSLNQATTEVEKEFGAKFQKVLLSRADFARDLLLPYGLDGFELGPLDLEGKGKLTRGYCAGNIVSIKYHSDNMPSETVLVQDLNQMLSLYSTYVAVRDGRIGESEELPADIASAQEAQRFRWHRRAERNQKLARDAKKIHGSTCMVCGFNFESRYGERGAGYIEAHHVVPFADLVKEPEPVTLDPNVDFVVVCANCHRMLHRSSPPISPDSLRLLLQ